MLKNDKINTVIALFLAVLLWAYVLGELDPPKSVTYRGVPLKFINSEILEEKGLVITDSTTGSIDISFSGQHSKVNKINKSDFEVTVNVLNVSEGENTLDIKINHPKGVTVEETSAEAVVLNVEKLVTTEKDINIELINLTSDDDEPYIVQVSKTTVNITGAESKVDNVSKVVAMLDATRVENTLKSLSVELTAVDSKGKQVEGVSLSFNNVSISAIIHKKKTVELIVPVIGQENGTIQRIIAVPKTVTIKGSEERLNLITSISTQPLNISEYFESARIKLEPVLPKGTELASNSTELTAEITVFNAGNAEFFFDENDVKISGVSEKYKVDIKSRDLVVSVHGKSDVVNLLKETDFSISASAEGLKPGVYELELEVSVNSAELDEMTIVPNTIAIEIEE